MERKAIRPQRFLSPAFFLRPSLRSSAFLPTRFSKSSSNWTFANRSWRSTMWPRHRVSPSRFLDPKQLTLIDESKAIAESFEVIFLLRRRFRQKALKALDARLKAKDPATESWPELDEHASAASSRADQTFPMPLDLSSSISVVTTDDPNQIFSDAEQSLPSSPTTTTNNS